MSWRRPISLAALIATAASCSGDAPMEPRPVPAPGAWREVSDVPAVGGLADICGMTDGAMVAVGDGGAALRCDGTRWTRIAIDTPSGLHSVWGTGSDDVYTVALASYHPGAKYNGLYHHDGSAWARLETGADGDVRVVWGRTATEVYVAGWEGAVARYDGSRWIDMRIADSVTVNDIWGARPDSLYAISDAGDLFRYDGQAWSAVPLDLPEGSGVPRFIEGASAGNIVLSGSATFVFDGAGWTRADHPADEYDRPVYFNDLHAAGENDYYAVSGGALYRFDGAVWSELWWLRRLLTAVCGGANGPVFVVDYDGQIWRYQDGEAVPLGLTTESIQDVWGSSADHIYAVGQSGVVLRYDGAGWAPEDTLGLGSVESVWGRGSDDVYAAAWWGVYHHDGTGWSESYRCGFGLNDIWGFPSGEVVAVGNHGIVQFDGARWSEFPVSARLEAVWGGSPRDLYAVGRYCVLHFDGERWDFVSSIVGDGWETVWGRADGAAYIGGDGVIRLDRGQWRRWEEAGARYVYRIWGPEHGEDVFLLDRSTVRHFDGRDWAEVDLYDVIGDQMPVYAIWGVSADDYYVGGYSGLLLHYRSGE